MIEGNTIIAANPTRARWRFSNLLLLAALGGESWYLVHDLPVFRRSLSTAAVTTAPIAELASRKNTVRVQAPNDLVWEDTREGQTLYRRQSILTSDHSRAEIAFLDGTGIILEENSLIQLEKGPSDESLDYQKIVIRLLRGTLQKIEPRKASQISRRISGTIPILEIHVANTVATVPASAELSVSAFPERADFRVHSGDLEIRPERGETLHLRPGDEASLRMNPSEEPTVVQAVPFLPLSPKPGATLNSEDAESLVVAWKNDLVRVSGSPLELEVSQDPEFKDSVQRVRIAAAEPPLEVVKAEAKLKARPELTRWYWRVKTVGANSLIGNTESFWVSASTAPRLKLPLANAEIPSDSPGFDLLWSDIPNAQDYELEISADSEPRLIRATKTFHFWKNDSAASPKSLSWRVRARFASGTTSPWSETRNLKMRALPITKPAEQALPPPRDHNAPEIIEESSKPAPGGDSSWLRYFFRESFAAEQETKTWKFKLKWSPVEGVKSYRVQVSRDQTFARLLNEQTVESPEIIWEYRRGIENSKGRVFYRVASVSEKGKIGLFSEPKPIQIPESVRGLDLPKKGEPTVNIANKKTRKPKPPGAPAPLETYSATEDAGPVEATDAAPAGNLETAISAPSAPEKKNQPQVVPTHPPAPARPDPVAGAGAKPEEARVEARSQVRTEGPRSTSWNASATIFTGFGNFKQTSEDTSLSSVSMESVYLQQKADLHLDLLHGPAEDPTHWTGEFQIQWAGYHKPSTPRTTIQPDVKGATYRFQALRWEKNSQPSSGNTWNIGYGLDVQSDFHWVKTSAQILDSQSSISFGPAASAVRNYGKDSGFHLVETGAVLALPLTGAITSGQYGLSGAMWGEWKLSNIKSSWIGARVEAEANYLRWSSSDATETLTWNGWLALSYHFGFEPSSDSL